MIVFTIIGIVLTTLILAGVLLEAVGVLKITAQVNFD
jgi:hypothetical protein